jgi:hypothetical protein
MPVIRKYYFIIVIPAIIYGCSGFMVEDHLDGDIRFEDYQEAWEITDEWYPYLDYKRINWDSIHDSYYPEIIGSYSDEYLMIINRMLLELKDGHVALILKNGKYFGYRTPHQVKDENSFDFSVTHSYITGKLYSLEDDRIRYGLIGDLGYLRVSTLSQGDWIESIDQAFDMLNNTQGLIFDIRHNSGGSTAVGSDITARFINEPLPTPGFDEKGIFHPGGNVQPDPLYNYTNPVVLLVNGIVFSSAEHLAMWMQHIDHVTLVGDTTGGGSGNPVSFILPSGNVVKVSTRYMYRYDGEPIEWNGIVPDIIVTQTESDLLNGEDKQLEYAIEYLTGN